MEAKFAKQLNPGDIILTCERGIQNAFSRFFQGSKRWHHVMLYVGKGKVLEVTPLKGCHISMFSLSQKSYKAVKVLRAAKLKFQTKRQLVQRAMKTFLGKRASVKRFFKLILFRAFPIISWITGWLIISKFTDKRKCNTKEIVCSTLVALAYYLNGCPVTKKIRPEYVLPKDFETAEGFNVVFEVT